ncbi:rhomboid family intramembrane serine protease [Flavobacteriaceae bacterium Ap0902]|nr:rhomboid family intramembrane serine protease [Flavobacteriaceae bacterium Ap0902]
MNEKAKIREAILIPTLLILVLVIVHLMNLPGCYGIIPRYLQGFRGVLLAPLFHSSWEHLFNNAYPILILGFMIFAFYRKIAYLLLTLGWMLTGILVWLFADMGILPSDTHIGCHIGASGIVYMMASFVFFSGIFRRSLPLIAVSLIVVFLYGSMLWGIFPEEVIIYSKEQANISWESHLFGAMVGLFFSYKWRKIGPQKKRFPWHRKDYYNIQDEILWQKYLEEFPEEEKPEKEEKPKFKDLF